MASKKDIMGFKSALKCMDPLEVKDCLLKTLNFLNKNNDECCFPSISLDREAFLMGLVSDTRNLKCKLFNAECEKIALDIIEILELNKNVFRWTYAHESWKPNEDFLVYKKIFSNKMKKPAAPKKSKSFSLVAHRLILAQDSHALDIPTGSKIQLLNTTLRFLKTDGEGVLDYPDMPVTHAQYMCDLVNSPSDLNVGFGFKSLYAPLFEAMEVYGFEYEFKISYVEKNGDVAALKLEKIRRNKLSVPIPKKVNQENCLDKKLTEENSFENSLMSESIVESNLKESNNSLNVSLNSSTSSNRSRTRRRRNRLKLTDGISSTFLSDTLQSLIAFTADVGKASVTFEGLNDREAAFVKGVKTLAASTSSHSSLEAPLRESLVQLNTNIVKVLETRKIRIEDGHTKSKARFITLKKVPRDTPTKQLSAFAVPTKSRAFAASSKDILTSKDNLIQFKSAGKLDPSTGEVDTTDNVVSTEGAQGSAKSKDYLNKRQTKLLEAMSVPVDSDKGKRMMELMGWAGGALGARGGGILEPILPAIELPVGAGLGHVPPPKPEVRRPADFRLSILHNIRDLLMHPETTKVIEYKLPLTKKEKSYVNTALPNLTKGKPPKTGVKEEVDLVKLILQDMALLDDMRLKADMSPDLRKVTITKCKKKKPLTTTQPIKKPGSVVKQDVPSTSTTTDREVVDDAVSEVIEVIDDIAISEVMATMSHTTCKTPVAIKGGAMRLLFLNKFIDVVRGRSMEREFRFVGVMQKKMLTFLENVVTSFNLRTRCSYVADEEMYLYDQLVDLAWERDCYLDIKICNNSKILITKMSDRFVARENVAKCSSPKPQDANNIDQQNKSVKINNIVNPNVANNAVANISKSGDENRITNLNEPIKKDNKIEADVDNHKEVTNVNSKCDSKANVQVQNEFIKDNLKLNEVNIQKSDIKPDNVSVENVAKIKSECDIKNKDNVINSINKDKADKKEIKADNDSESSWSTCSENEVDLTIFDKEIKELDKVLGEVGLGFNVRDSEASFSPATDSQDFEKLNAKKARTRCKNCVVVIAPKSTDEIGHPEMFKTVQTIIWNQIDKEDYAIPLLKCHGVQNGGLVYSCHDERDVAWLKRTIKMAKLNLKVFIFADDFIEDRKSRKLAIRINSFMPLDAKKVFRKFEMYNDIDTHLWKVLSYESFESYAIFIVEVDEISFEYIAEDNFSLYMGIDRAQFSIIF